MQTRPQWTLMQCRCAPMKLQVGAAPRMGHVPHCSHRHIECNDVTASSIVVGNSVHQQQSMPTVQSGPSRRTDPLEHVPHTLSRPSWARHHRLHLEGHHCWRLSAEKMGWSVAAPGPTSWQLKEVEVRTLPVEKKWVCPNLLQRSGNRIFHKWSSLLTTVPIRWQVAGAQFKYLRALIY